MPKAKLEPLHVFKRLSQITGIPIRNLFPTRETKTPFRDMDTYNPRTHSYSIDPNRTKNEKKITIREEVYHAGQFLLMEAWKNILRPIGKRKILKMLPQFDNWREGTNPAVPRKPKATWERAIQIARLSRTFKRIIIQKHGRDAILLLWADTPRFDKQPPNPRLDILEAVGPLPLQLKQWEQKMVQSGYLKPKGGFTSKGLRYFREKVQPQDIWRVLKAAELQRSKSTKQFYPPEFQQRWFE